MGMYCRHGMLLLGTILEHLGVLFFCVFLCQKLSDSAAVTFSFLFSILKAAKSSLATRPKSLQHEYKCFFGSHIDPQNFKFSKKIIITCLI